MLINSMKLATGAWWMLSFNDVAAQFPAESSIDDLQPEQAFAINGTANSGAFGFGTSTIGDFNGDGFDDIIISARTSDNGADNSGSCYVVFGSDQALPTQFDISQLDGNNGFAIHGVSTNDLAGWSVNEAGDVNNDGIDDLIIGAKSANPISAFTGAAYVIFGTTAAMPAEFNLAGLNGLNGFRLIGESNADEFGSDVAGTGDVNNDGIDDIIIGAFRADNNGVDSGAVYVVFGRLTFPSSIAVADLDGDDGMRINATIAGERLGVSISTAGDFNADGISDMLMGAYYATPNTDTRAGKAYVVFGQDTTSGNFDFPAVLELSTLHGSTGIVLHGPNENDSFGRELTYAGDINNDGIADIAVQAPGDDTNATSAGAVYVIYGSSDLISSPINVSGLDGDDGFVMHGESNGDQTGNSLNYGGDFNDDGIDDLIIGIADADTPVTNAGSAYLLYGWALPFPAAFDIENVSNANGFVIEGNDSWDQTGIAVDHAGDFNGDNISDLLISARGNDFNGNSDGTVFVVFGSSDIIFKSTFDH